MCVTNGTRLDNLWMRGVAWVVAKGWMRVTRHTPQMFAQVMLGPYVLGLLAGLYRHGDFGQHPHLGDIGFNVGLSLFVLWWISRAAVVCASLSSTEPTAEALAMAGRVCRSRGGVTLVVILLTCVSFTGGHTNIWQQVFYAVSAAAWVLAVYAVTIGRVKPPPKKQRHKVHIRLPRLLPSGV